MLYGSVIAFDDAVGLGMIIGDDGDEFAFHCIEIADGTRTIAVGQTVVFAPLARLGHIQAAQIHKL